MSSAGTASNQTELLLNAFQSFNEVSSALQSAYSDLQGRVHHLSEQLEQRNYFLTTVLQSLPCGVLVVDRTGGVTTLNRAARELFGIDSLATPFPLSAILEGAGFSDRADLLMEDGEAAPRSLSAGTWDARSTAVGRACEMESESWSCRI